MKHIAKSAAVLLYLSSVIAFAQMPPLKEIPAPDEPGETIALPIENATFAATPESWADLGGNPILRNVSKPTLTAIFPVAGKATGAAVIVAPGGAYLFLSMKSEGFDVAKRLAEHGIAAFVLKYRVDPSPADLKSFGGQVVSVLTAAMLGKAPPDAMKARAPAIEDAEAALKLVRARAPEWGIDPKRVGLLGFSAGAMTTLGVVAANAHQVSPDFIGAFYPPMDALTIPQNAPPMFAAIASDDPLFGGKGFGLIETWQQAKRPVEFHLYEQGGHGFADHRGGTSEHWFDEFLWWMEMRGLLKAG